MGQFGLERDLRSQQHLTHDLILPLTHSSADPTHLYTPAGAESPAARTPPHYAPLISLLPSLSSSAAAAGGCTPRATPLASTTSPGDIVLAYVFFFIKKKKELSKIHLVQEFHRSTEISSLHLPIAPTSATYNKNNSNFVYVQWRSRFSPGLHNVLPRPNLQGTCCFRRLCHATANEDGDQPPVQNIAAAQTAASPGPGLRRACRPRLKTVGSKQMADIGEDKSTALSVALA